MTEAELDLTAFKGVKMLVVDDDHVFRGRLERALTDRGLEVRGAGGFVHALEVATSWGPELALLDLRLPGGTGIELLESLQSALPDLQVVMLTGYGSIANALEAVRRGALDYLTKPADADQILAAFAREGGEHDVEPPAEAPSLDRVEWEHIQRVLSDCDGNITRAAKVLGVHRRTLQRKLARHPPSR